MNVEDPLNQQDLQVVDVASARFALKLANDYHFAVVHMREQMDKEFARSEEEVRTQTLAILRLYISGTDNNGHPTRLTHIPDPLPEEVPQEAVDAIAYLKNQLALEKVRVEADFLEQATPLNELKAWLEGLVREWALGIFRENPLWLARHNQFTLGGCTLTYDEGDISFEYEELSYD